MGSIKRILMPKGSNVLFVCNANINRSPMAAAIFADKSKAYGYDYCVASVGIMDMTVGASAARQWKSVPGAEGYDLSHHRSRYLYGPDVYTSETFFFCMEQSVVATVLRAPNVQTDRVHLLNPPDGIFDPIIPGTPRAFSDCFTQLYTSIDKLLDRIDLQ